MRHTLSVEPAVVSRAFVVAAVGLVTLGCRETRTLTPAIDTSSIRPVISYYVGSPLSGPLDDVAIDFEDPWPLRCTVLSDDRDFGGAPLETLAGHTRLIGASDEGDPVRSTPQLCSNVRLAVASEGISFDDAVSGVALPGATTVTSFTLPTSSGARTVEIALYRPTASREPTSTSADGDAASVEMALVVHSGVGQAARQETMHLESIDVDAPSAFVFELSVAPLQVVFAVVEVRPRRSIDLRDEAVAAALEKNVAAARDALRPVPPEPDSDVSFPALASVVGGLSQPRGRRTTLLFLARRSGARLCADLALVAPPLLLGDLSRRILDDSGASDAKGESELGFALERVAFHFLAERMNEPDLDPGLEGLLILRSGEVARRPSAIDAILAIATDLESLEAALTRENRVLLQDGSPSARMRAYEWLDARGEAPDEYDPFADRSARQRAIDAWTARQRAATSSTEGRGA